MAASVERLIRALVDVHSGAVWASTSPVAVDGDSWTLLLWQVQEQGVHWQTLVSDGGKAIEDAAATVAPEAVHQRDVWHVLHACQQVQARLDRLVERLKAQTATVARQAARLAAGKRARGRHPKSDVATHAAELAQAQYAAESVGYLSAELQRLLSVVVLASQPAQGVLCWAVRQQELETVLVLLDELQPLVPATLQTDVANLLTHLQAALPQLVLFAPPLDALQEQVGHELGVQTLHLLGWAWQRRAILGKNRAELLANLPPTWRTAAEPLLRAWDEAVRASSAVENWHSILRPYLAVHRSLSTGLLALLAVWHNHRIAQRGLHQGQSPLMRSGMTDVASDWLLASGYPPQGLALLPESAAQPELLLALAA